MPSLRRQTGVGLVEIMVSLTIGLVIIAALVALFVGTSRNNRQMATANSMIENGRFAIQLLQEDIIHAGYWGQFVPAFDDQTGSTTTAPTDVPTALPDPCAAYGTWDAAYRNNLIGIPMQAYDTAAVCTGVVTDKLADTDMLVVRHLDTCAVGETGCEAETADKLYMQVAPVQYGDRDLRHGPLGHRHFRPHHAQLHDSRGEAEVCFPHLLCARLRGYRG